MIVFVCLFACVAWALRATVLVLLALIFVASDLVLKRNPVVEPPSQSQFTRVIFISSSAFVFLLLISETQTTGWTEAAQLREAEKQQQSLSITFH